MKITQRAVEAMQKDPDRDTFLWDGELRGFGVRMLPSGAASSSSVPDPGGPNSAQGGRQGRDAHRGGSPESRP